MNASLFALIFVAICLVPVTEQYSESKKERFEKFLHQHVVKCALDEDSSEEEWQAVLNQGPLNTLSEKCLQYCVYKELDLLFDTDLGDEEHAFRVDEYMHSEDSNYDPSKREELVRKCRKEAEAEAEKSNDQCEVAAKMQSCFREG